VPFWLYLWGGAATLVISFILVGLFLNRTEGNTNRVLNLPRFNLQHFTNLAYTLKIISVLLFILTIVTGLFGVDNSLANFNMTFFWIIFLLGFYYLTALIGDIYDVINPFKIIFSSIKSQLIKYPLKLGYWPALIFFLILIWLELFLGVTPFKLSLILVIYSIINFLGISLIGQKDWFEYCELFSVLFRLIGNVGSVANPPKHFSLVVFILFMLSSTAFDGIHSTLPWYRLLVSLGGDLPTEQRVGLILSPFIFLALYLLGIQVMKLVTQSKLSVIELSKSFAFSLIPIALAYNIAHYYTLLINQGQEIIRLISDPFGFNWNLFGTGDFQGNLFTDAGFIWHSQVGVILFGHIMAVYLSHLIALQVFKTRKLATISQIPMLILMICYTMVGLWILSQPITSKI
jgi:hypothetical protein